MSYHVRNPYQKALREGKRDLQVTESSPTYTVIRGNTQQRLTNTSKDKKVSNENEDDNSSKVTYEEVAFKANPNQPVVTYSTRKPNYPTGYSCEHSLFYIRDGHDENVASAAAMLSHSEDVSNDISIELNYAPVRLSLEFEVPIDNPDSYDEIVSNVEALQWSLLNKISASTGLSKGCKIENQYDERSMVTAITSMNDMHSTFTDSQGNRRHSNSRKHRRRTREVRTNRGLLATLPYPTSVYSVSSTRPKWTAFCSSEIVDESEAGKCFTAEINFDVKYRGTTGESNLIEEYIQSIIHNQIALDAKQLFAEDITGLRWIPNDQASAAFGDSDLGTLAPIFGPSSSLEGEGDTTSSKGLHGLYASLIIPLATAFFVICIWLCVHMYDRKKRRDAKVEKQKRRSEGPTGAQDNNDLETGSAGTGKTRDLHSKDSLDSQDSQEASSTKYCTEAMAKAMGLSSAASSALQGTLSSTGVRRHRSCPVSVDSPERSTGGLPPRPVTAKRAVSMPLKKKRRKKKKKKKQVMSLKRINSRENIVEMPIISESESECDSDEEEYCDDGSSYDASSCSTPNRESRSSSRASSPQKSPREDPDQPDFEFVIEAPDFPNDYFSEEPKFSEDLFAEDDKKQVVGVDENLPPNLTLRPRMNAEQENLKQPVLPVASKKDAPLGESRKERLPRSSLEIDTKKDTSVDSNDSFVEENGTVMERMLPLPWLDTKSNKSNKRVSR